MWSFPNTKTIRIGVVGTGFIARRMFDSARLMSDLRVTRALTRRPLESCDEVPGHVQLTHSLQDVIDHADVVVECSGDPVHATPVVREALDAGLPVITMNSEFHVTCGSHFVDRGYLTEAHGDQPGVQAALHLEATGMGFEPIAYGNMKGFLNLDPKAEEMQYWASRQGFSVQQTTSFTDGTKVQIEQAFVANSFGADIAKPGLLALRSETFEEATGKLAAAAVDHGTPISDFIVVPGQAPGVFVIATIDESQRPVLEALKMGPGPHYTLVRPYHLCALEIPNTIRQAVQGHPPLLNNSATPTIGVAAVAKKALQPGDQIDVGIGSFLVRGEAVRLAERPDHVPIGILAGATITRRVAAGEMLTLDQVDLPPSEARDIALGSVQDAALRRSAPSAEDV
ncbi:MAG: NAD(P)-dependent oxidoreductase [Myxococcota bacterium]